MKFFNHKSPIVFGFIAAMMVMAIVQLIDFIEIKTFNQTSRMHVKENLDVIGGKLKSAINNRLTLVQGLVAFVKSQDEITEDKFIKFATQLEGLHEGVISLQLAPKAVVTFVTNKERNEKAIGHNLLVDQKRRQSVLKAINNREYIIAGPLNLIQGGTALIGRWPIFKTNPAVSSKHGAFWGFATILIDVHFLFKEAGLMAKQTGDLQFALRGKNGLGAKGDVFFGNKKLFDANPLIADISLPSGSWQLAALPIAGWQSNWAGRNFLWIGGFILALLVGWTIYTLTSDPMRLRKVIESTTNDLQESDARLHGAVNSLQESFALYGADGKLILCNEGYKRRG